MCPRVERMTEGGGAIPVVTPVPACVYFSAGYCNSQSDISSAQRPEALHTRCANVSTQRTVYVY